MTRCTQLSSFATWAARANACLGRLDVADVGIDADVGDIVVEPRRAGRFAASLPATTGLSASYSTTTRSAASLAWAAVSATTIATGSPTKRTRSVMQQRVRAHSRAGEPSRLISRMSAGGFIGIGVCGISLIPSAAASAPVSTASTPGMVRASAVSIERMRAWACGERTRAA